MYATLATKIDLENPMVMVDYYNEPKPDDIAICPVCGKTWEGYDAGYGRLEWDSAATTGAPAGPSPNGCWECVMTHADGDWTAQFIQEKKLQQEALEWCICRRSDWRGWIEDDYVPLVWQTLKPLLLHEDLLRDFLEDQHREEFIEWALDH